MIDFLLTLTIFKIIKLFLIVGMLMYSVFAIVIVKQTLLMGESIEDDFNALITLFAWIHLIGALALVVVAFLL